MIATINGSDDVIVSLPTNTPAPGSDPVLFPEEPAKAVRVTSGGQIVWESAAGAAFTGLADLIGTSSQTNDGLFKTSYTSSQNNAQALLADGTVATLGTLPAHAGTLSGIQIGARLLVDLPGNNFAWCDLEGNTELVTAGSAFTLFDKPYSLGTFGAWPYSLWVDRRSASVGGMNLIVYDGEMNGVDFIGLPYNNVLSSQIIATATTGQQTVVLLNVTTLGRRILLYDNALNLVANYDADAIASAANAPYDSSFGKVCIVDDGIIISSNFEEPVQDDGGQILYKLMKIDFSGNVIWLGGKSERPTSADSPDDQQATQIAVTPNGKIYLTREVYFFASSSGQAT
jgi:hypothetical protein